MNLGIRHFQKITKMNFGKNKHDELDQSKNFPPHCYTTPSNVSLPLHYLWKTGLENKFILLHISFHLKSVIPKAESKSFFPERNIFCQSRYCQKLQAASTTRDKYRLALSQPFCRASRVSFWNLE